MRRQVDGAVPGDKYKQQSGMQRRRVACFINKNRHISSDFHQKRQFPSGGFLVGSNNKLGGFVFEELPAISSAVV